MSTESAIGHSSSDDYSFPDLGEEDFAKLDRLVESQRYIHSQGLDFDVDFIDTEFEDDVEEDKVRPHDGPVAADSTKSEDASAKKRKSSPVIAFSAPPAENVSFSSVSSAPSTTSIQRRQQRRDREYRGTKAVMTSQEIHELFLDLPVNPFGNSTGQTFAIANLDLTASADDGQDEVHGKRLTESSSRAESRKEAEKIEEQRSDILGWSIPSATMTAALDTLNTKTPTYWNHELYRDRHDREITVHYCCTKEHSERIAKTFLNEPVLGFDMEWVATFFKWRDGTSIKHNVSVVQIAHHSTIAVFHIAKHPGKTVDELFAPSLRKILESPKILKAGVNVVKADGGQLRLCGIQPQGLHDLHYAHGRILKADGYQRGEDEKIGSMAFQVKYHLKLPMYKGKVRTSNWSKAIDAEQLKYAAADAYAGFLLYQIYQRRIAEIESQAPNADDTELSGTVEGARSNASKGTKVAEPPARGSPNTPRTPKAAKPKPEDDLNASDRLLFDALRADRTVAARVRNTAPQYVASNEVLCRIATEKPLTLEDLLAVKGIGPDKADKYGEAWMRLVSKHTDPADHQATNIKPRADVRVIGSAKGLPQVDGFSSPRAERSPPPVSYDRIARNSETNHYSKPLLGALNGLRNKLAKEPGVHASLLPTAWTLKQLAIVQPSNNEELEYIDSGEAFVRLCTKYKIDYFAFAAKRTGREQEPASPVPAAPLAYGGVPLLNHDKKTPTKDVKKEETDDSNDADDSDESDESDYFETIEDPRTLATVGASAKLPYKLVAKREERTPSGSRRWNI